MVTVRITRKSSADVRSYTTNAENVLLHRALPTRTGITSAMRLDYRAVVYCTNDNVLVYAAY